MRTAIIPFLLLVIPSVLGQSAADVARQQRGKCKDQ